MNVFVTVSLVPCIPWTPGDSLKGKDQDRDILMVGSGDLDASQQGSSWDKP